jgi:hypothetical protein
VACLAIVFKRAEINRHHSAARDHIVDRRLYPTIELGGYRLSSFRVFPRRLAAGYRSPLDLNQEKFPSSKAKVTKMKIHPGIKPAVWGAVVGAVSFTVVGFSSLGWTLGSTAEKMASQRAETAVVAVLAPICVEKFQQQTDAAAKLVALNKVSTSWDRRSLIEKGGWATFPGTDKPNSAVASACAEKLGSPT